MLRLFVLLVALLGCTVAQHVHIIPEGAVILTPFPVALTIIISAGYKYGEVVNVECRGADGQWGAPLVCIQTGQPMSFKYGIDSFQHCGVAVDDELYGFFSKLIKRDGSTCLSPFHTFADTHFSSICVSFNLWITIMYCSHFPFFLPFFGLLFILRLCMYLIISFDCC